MDRAKDTAKSVEKEMRVQAALTQHKESHHWARALSDTLCCAEDKAKDIAKSAEKGAKETGDKASDAAHKAGDKASSAAGQVKHDASNTADKAKHEANKSSNKPKCAPVLHSQSQEGPLPVAIRCLPSSSRAGQA